MRDTTFLLVRHGETDWNVQRRIQGHSDDAGLTEHGVAQVRAAAERLLTSGATRIISSDLVRARETAQLIALRLKLPIEFDAHLRERSYGELEGHSLDELTPEGSGFSHGVIVDLNAAAPGGESIAQVKERVVDALDRLAHDYPGEIIIIVTHGGIIRTLRAAQSSSMLGHEWSQVDNAEIWEMSVPVRS